MNQDRRWENEYHTKQIEIPEFMQQKTEPRGRRPSHNARQKTAMPVRSAVPQPRQRDRGVRPPPLTQISFQIPRKSLGTPLRRAPDSIKVCLVWRFVAYSFYFR